MLFLTVGPLCGEGNERVGACWKGVCCATAGWGPESKVTEKEAFVELRQGAVWQGKSGGGVAGNLVWQVGPSPLEGAWPCLTSSQRQGQIECASVACSQVDWSFRGRKKEKGGERKEDEAT